MADPLGTRPKVVQVEDLTRWNLTTLLESREDENGSVEYHPFPWRNDLNAKIILWYNLYFTFIVSSINT